MTPVKTVGGRPSGFLQSEILKKMIASEDNIRMVSIMKKYIALSCSLALAALSPAQQMDELWGSGRDTIKLRAKDAKRGQLFDEGNYAMFIHWGLYSMLGNKVEDKTYYGIGEWIMSPRVADIPPEEYKKLAGQFNPTDFNAKEIVQLAKDAGMKYIVITAKHHDGFAMYDSKANDFNITKATPWGIDPMKELVKECEEQGIGFGFYYSHNQDWTYPGGGQGPTTDADGNEKTFEDYFREKCLPQVEEITSEYGKIELVWFDTPGAMDKSFVEELVQVVRKNQPNALISGRAGHNLGDYNTLGDMEVPHENVSGLWESVDTTNDSWAYAWYDEYWKTPKEILKRTIGTVGRGGTYMLNIGPDGKGAVPERAKTILRQSGEWIQKYPNTIYNAGASPFGHELPWGDVTTKGNTMQLSVFKWPNKGKLYLPAIENKINSITLLTPEGPQELTFEEAGSGTAINIPYKAPDDLVSVIRVEVDGEPKASHDYALDPTMATKVYADFGTAEGAVKKQRIRWMEKFGEWKAAKVFTKWEEGGKAVFEVDVLVPGDYNASLTYKGEGRLVWNVAIDGGQVIQNQQNSSHNLQEFQVGWLHFPKAGKYKINVSCLNAGLGHDKAVNANMLGNPAYKDLSEEETLKLWNKKAALNALHLEPVNLIKK